MSAQREKGRHGPQPTIKVSEIGEYGYCSRAWWYKHIVKLPLPHTADYERLVAGTRAHRTHGMWVASGARLRAVGLALAVCGLLALSAALVLYFAH